MTNKLERRFTHRQVELRLDNPDHPPKIVGYGAVFDSRSEDLGGFDEVIERGAFDDVLDDDVRALFNHDDNFILGRRASGTLKLSIDDFGLKYEIDPPDTQMIRDMVLEPMRRGDITQSSFGFFVGEDDWSEDRNGKVTRTIHKIERLIDVSPVTFPAYPNTDVALRKLNAFVDRSSKFAEELASDDSDIIELMTRCIEQMESTGATLHQEVAQIIQRAQEELLTERSGHTRTKKALELHKRLNSL